MTDLIKRLRAQKFSGRHRLGGGTVTSDGLGKASGGERIMELCNPDGPEAATAIEARDAEITRLKALIAKLCTSIHLCSGPCGYDSFEARAALTGKDDP